MAKTQKELKEEQEKWEADFKRYKEACEYCDKMDRQQNSGRLEEALRNLGGNYGRSGS